ncbi:MAG: HAMP domain-containing histidine kinase [Planctomycetaceae bacterium]|nr:HAMP domain-containing histidine kinase [Planctomycetaceae bacterium]
MASFPPVAVLLRGCLPFANAADLLQKIATTWCEVLGCQQVCLTRWEPETSSLHVFTLTRGAEWDAFDTARQTIPIAGDGRRAEVIAAELFSAGGRSYPLNTVSREVGWIHLVHPQPPAEIPRDWLDQTSRLVLQAGQWDASLLQAKLDALGEYAAGAGHEVNNPLAAISGRAQQLMMHETDPERRRHLETIGAQTLRVRDMITDSMLFARPPVPQQGTVSLRAAWDTLLDRMRSNIGEKNAHLQLVEGDGVILEADEPQLMIVLSELLHNSLRAISEGGSVELEVRNSDGRLVHLIWRDNGNGLTEPEREHLFDPFFSGRQAGRGLGFGLSKAWRIVTQHGGQIVCLSNLKAGVEFHLHWPASQQPDTTFQ